MAKSKLPMKEEPGPAFSSLSEIVGSFWSCEIDESGLATRNGDAKSVVLIMRSETKWGEEQCEVPVSALHASTLVAFEHSVPVIVVRKCLDDMRWVKVPESVPLTLDSMRGDTPSVLIPDSAFKHFNLDMVEKKSA